MEKVKVMEIIEETQKIVETKSQILKNFNTLIEQINLQFSQLSKITNDTNLEPLCYELKRIRQNDDFDIIIGVELDFTDASASLAFCKWREYSEFSAPVSNSKEYFTNPSDIETIRTFLEQFDKMFEYFLSKLRANTKQLSNINQELSDLILEKKKK